MDTASHNRQVPQDEAALARSHLRHHRMRRAAFAASDVHDVIEALIETEWISENVLAKGFEGTQGFSLQFTRAGLPKVRQRLPALSPFLDLIDASQGLDELISPLSRWFRKPQLPQPNAFYLNLLEVPVEDCVTPHIDGTLTLTHGFPWSPPIFNTVMYLRVLPNNGRFALRLPGQEPTYFQEETGDVLYFRGDCVHSIDKLRDDFIDASDQRSRLSLVCEHYYFTPEMLSKVPPMKLESKDAFKRILAKKRHPLGPGSGVTDEML